jgi:ribonuclease HI
MELTAALRCLEHTGDKDVTLYTDSCYLKNGITKWILTWKRNGWKTAAGQPVKNRELWIQIDDLNGPHVKWQWVKAHNGHPFNEKADRLAHSTAESFQKSEPKSVERISIN